MEYVTSKRESNNLYLERREQNVSLSPPTGEVQTLLYGGDGDLRRKTVGIGGVAQSDVRLLKDGQVVLQESDVATGSLLRHYTNGGGEWGNLISLAQGDNTGGRFNLSRFNLCEFNQTSGPPYALSRFYAFDHIGTTRLLLDAAGNAMDTSLFSGYGTELDVSGSTDTPFGFDGNWQYFRLTPNLLLAGARIYDPVSGAWLSPDPIGSEGGDWNLFRYVENKPVKNVDFLGLSPTPVPAPTPPNNLYRKIVIWKANEDNKNEGGTHEAARILRSRGYDVIVLWKGSPQQLINATKSKYLAGLFIGGEGVVGSRYISHMIKADSSLEGPHWVVTRNPKSKLPL